MSLQSEADAVLHQAVANGDVPGVVAAATDRGGTIYEGGFGERVLGTGTPMSTDTVGWIASMTKALTGTAAMQLVEQGRLELDRPAADWMPEIGEIQVLEGFDEGGQPQTRPPRRPITLRHLLTHTAGFAYEIWSEEIIRYQQAKGLPGIITCQNAALADLLGGRPFLFGDRPHGADAACYGFLANIFYYPIDTPLRDFITAHPALGRDCEAMHAAVTRA